MAGEDESKAEASAEKAYAAASEGVSEPKKAAEKPIVQATPDDLTADTPIEIPAVKPAAKAAPAPKEAKPAPAAKEAAPAAPKVKAAKPKAAPKPKVAKPKAAPKPKAVAKPAPKPVAAPKPAVPAMAKKVAAPKAAAKSVAKPIPVKPAPVAAKPVPAATAKIATKIKTTTPTFIVAKSKDQVMKISEKLSGGLHSVSTEAQAKAKEAFEKSKAVIGDYAAFTKGNVEAVVESGKILAGGLQDMGTSLVAESRAAFESASADLKELAAAKSPTDLIQLQSEMFRKNFDSAVAYGSKNTEAMIKLASEAMAPISSRVSLAVEKVRMATA